MLTGQIVEVCTNLNTGMDHTTIQPKDANAVLMKAKNVASEFRNHLSEVFFHNI